LRLPSGREFEVSDLTYGQALELRKYAEGESPTAFQVAALRALAPGFGKLDKLDLLVLVKEVDRVIAGRTQDEEGPFREQLAAGLGGHQIGDPTALSRLMAFRWCGLLRWPYQDVADTPLDALPLCLRFGWTRQQLMATPAVVVRDFLLLIDYEKEIAKNGN